MSRTAATLAAIALFPIALGCTPADPTAGVAGTPAESAPEAATPAGDDLAADRHPGLPPNRPLRAAFVLVDGVYNTELVAPWDVLEHARYHTAPAPGIEVFTVAAGPDPVTTAEGLRIVPDYTFDDSPPVDILVVPSARESRGKDLEDRVLIDWVRATGEEASFVMSLCWGAFVLAEAGLLDGRACTTFPSDYELFSRRFPDLDLRVNVTYVHDSKALTSEGGAPSFAAAMYLVDFLYGEEVARRIGRGLLIPWPPDGRGTTATITDPTYGFRAEP